MSHTTEDTAQWLLGNFRGAKITSEGKEVKFLCPKCGYENFYFNPAKQVGVCHKAKCRFSPKLEDLIKIIGHGPVENSTTGLFFRQKEEEESRPITWPSHCVDIKYDHKGIEALEVRGIPFITAKQYGIRSQGSYICVPVYHEQKLVNIIRRKINRKKSGPEIWSEVPHEERYLYLTGVKTGNYLFDYDKFQRQEHLSLVENTFNAIKYGISTNFGSNLTGRQVELIKNSKIKSVFFLWDAGTSTDKAIKKLNEVGVKAESFSLAIKQPDYFPEVRWDECCKQAHDVINSGEFDEWVQYQPLSKKFRSYN